MFNVHIWYIFCVCQNLFIIHLYTIYYQISFGIEFLTLNCSIVKSNANVIWQCFHDEFLKNKSKMCTLFLVHNDSIVLKSKVIQNEFTIGIDCCALTCVLQNDIHGFMFNYSR